MEKRGRQASVEAGSVGEVMEPASFRSRAKDFEIRACKNKSKCDTEAHRLGQVTNHMSNTAEHTPGQVQGRHTQARSLSVAPTHLHNTDTKHIRPDKGHTPTHIPTPPRTHLEQRP